MKWGLRNAIFHVAKEEGSDEVLGVAMWLPPCPSDQPPTWNDWIEGWRLWANQVAMNLYYGRGGLIVKVCLVFQSRQESNCLLTIISRPAVLHLERCSSQRPKRAMERSKGLLFSEHYGCQPKCPGQRRRGSVDEGSRQKSRRRKHEMLS